MLTQLLYNQQLAEQETEIKDLKKQLESSKPALLKASEQVSSSNITYILLLERSQADVHFSLFLQNLQLQMKQQIENLKRENKLLASAFYDLSSRLQLNNVSLQRRSEAPRSFLNKQRLLVNQATAVRMPR